jgi:hypothetical protein
VKEIVKKIQPGLVAFLIFDLALCVLIILAVLHKKG